MPYMELGYLQYLYFRETLAFATEPVFASLANILGNHDNMGIVSKELEEYKMYDVEIKYGLLQVKLWSVDILIQNRLKAWITTAAGYRVVNYNFVIDIHCSSVIYAKRIDSDFKVCAADLCGSVRCASNWGSGGCGQPLPGQQYPFVEIDHEIFSVVILSLPQIQEGQLSVSCKRMCTILVNC